MEGCSWFSYPAWEYFQAHSNRQAHPLLCSISQSFYHRLFLHFVGDITRERNGSNLDQQSFRLNLPKFIDIPRAGCRSVQACHPFLPPARNLVFGALKYRHCA